MRLTANRLQCQPSEHARQAIVNHLALAYSRTLYLEIQAACIAELRGAKGPRETAELLEQYRRGAEALGVPARAGGHRV
jgi:hypothetical protein